MLRKCPNCGANLDPGEICDCRKEAASDESDPKAAIEKIIFNNSIPNKNLFVNKGEEK